MRAEAKTWMFEFRFRFVCRRIAVAMGQKRTGIWAKQPDLQPAHGEPDNLLEAINQKSASSWQKTPEILRPALRSTVRRYGQK